MSPAFWISYGLLWFLLAVALVGMFGLYYHFAQTYLNSPQGRTDGQGPKLDAPAPIPRRVRGGASLPSFDGSVPKAVLFFSDRCPLCEELLHEIGTITTSSVASVYVAGNQAAVTRWREVAPPSWTVLSDPDRKVAESYLVRSTPYCFVVDENAVVVSKGNVNTFKDIEDAYRSAHKQDSLETGV